MIQGLFETPIKVADLDRAMTFYHDTLGLELGRLEPDRRVAFYWVGQRGEAKLPVGSTRRTGRAAAACRTSGGR